MAALTAIHIIFSLCTCELIRVAGANYTREIENCPSDCICYPDFLSNLVSWEWIEDNVHSSLNDQDNLDFNPYVEHNEVYDIPRRSAKYRTHKTYQTVTCILRTDSTEIVLDIFTGIPTSTQVLSVLQGPGSGNITIGNKHFQRLTELVGLDIQGYKESDNGLSNRPNSLRVEADALLSLKKLTYLNLDNVLLQQHPVAALKEEYTSKIVTIRKISPRFNGYTEEESDVLHNLESQLIFLTPTSTKSKEPIVPYNIYKTSLKIDKKIGEQSKGEPPEPKIAVAFTDIPTLLHLRISECNMQDITWDLFYGLHSLKFLLLERNDLLFLPDFVFYSTPNLTKLSLSGNRILSLHTVGLAGLLYLQKLDVSNNNITHLSELSLPPFPHLEVADFRNNPIETIFPNTFEVMNTTTSLYLGNKRIPLQIFPNSFFGLTNLLNLDITNIRIDIFERPMLNGLLNLKSLVMNGQLRRISYDAFNEAPTLEILILKNCQIERLSMDSFLGLRFLNQLDLSYNQLTFLPPGIFDDQFSVREIYLQHNLLTTLSPNIFGKITPQITRLDGNPWHCSCDMSTWNPSQINQIKSYHIPRNDTLCDRRFDKGNVCDRIYTKLQVKYIYEKRVSPVCSTPMKFTERNVFDVLRKELRYCLSLGKSKNKTGKLTKYLEANEKSLFSKRMEKLRKASQIVTKSNEDMKLNETTTTGRSTDPNLAFQKSSEVAQLTEMKFATINSSFPVGISVTSNVSRDIEDQLSESAANNTNTMSNLIIPLLPLNLPTPSSLEPDDRQFKLFKSSKSKLSTPKPLKPFFDDGTNSNLKHSYKKILKLGKLKTTQNSDQSM